MLSEVGGLIQMLRRGVWQAKAEFSYWKWTFFPRREVLKLNLCCGTQRIPGYFGIDVLPGADLRIDVSRRNLPLASNQTDAVVCMSAINYFTRSRGQEIVCEIHRVLRVGGVCRMGVQDIRMLAERYIQRDQTFYFQKLPDGSPRFEGETFGDKFASWFYGYATGQNRCRYAYDFESLELLFKRAGFSKIERKAFGSSELEGVEFIDNRPDQMFFLEAVK